MATTIFIPFIHNSCDINMIKYVFKHLQIANVSSVDLIKNGYNYKGFVHIESWFNNTASLNLQEKISNGEQAKIVYDDPYYWVILKNTSSGKGPSVQEQLDCAFMMIEDLQSRLLEVELRPPLPLGYGGRHQTPPLSPPPPPPVLRRQMAVDGTNLIHSNVPFNPLTQD